MTEAKPPQTFEEWWKSQDREDPPAYQAWDAGYSAGVASQKAEIERLIDERMRFGRTDQQAKLAEAKVARYEAVMEAVRELELAIRQGRNQREPIRVLRAALAALEEKT